MGGLKGVAKRSLAKKSPSPTEKQGGSKQKQKQGGSKQKQGGFVWSAGLLSFRLVCPSV